MRDSSSELESLLAIRAKVASSSSVSSSSSVESPQAACIPLDKRLSKQFGDLFVELFSTSFLPCFCNCSYSYSSFSKGQFFTMWSCLPHLKHPVSYFLSLFLALLEFFFLEIYLAFLKNFLNFRVITSISSSSRSELSSSMTFRAIPRSFLVSSFC